MKRAETGEGYGCRIDKTVLAGALRISDSGGPEREKIQIRIHLYFLSHSHAIMHNDNMLSGFFQAFGIILEKNLALVRFGS